MKRLVGMCVFVAGATLLSSAQAADFSQVPTPTPTGPLPAVSTINGSFDLTGGGSNGGGLGLVGGKIAVPLGYSTGLQADGMIGDLDGGFYAHGALHGFWRDPAKGLIGAYASFDHLNAFGGVELAHTAFEAEAYLGQFTLRGIAGLEFGSSGTFDGGLKKLDIQNRFFDKVDVAFYPVENVSVYLGQRYTGGVNAAAIGGEYLFHVGAEPVSAFVEGRVGDHSYRAIWGGLKFYFGDPAKTLIHREREDDPDVWAPDSTISQTAGVKTISHPSPTPTPTPTPTFTLVPD